MPTVFADPGRVELRVALKDVGQPGSPTSPTDNNAVTITRYRIWYQRSDGRAVPGVDVPFAFDGAATVTIDASGSAALAFELVRVQAKHEAPLRNLRGGGGALAISVVADVTFYGRDTVGREISAAGPISVVFADSPIRNDAVPARCCTPATARRGHGSNPANHGSGALRNGETQMLAAYPGAARLRPGVIAAVIACGTGCTIADTRAPSVTGPSELGVAIALQATPDVLVLDGISEATVAILVRDANGQPSRRSSCVPTSGSTA